MTIAGANQIASPFFKWQNEQQLIAFQTFYSKEKVVPVFDSVLGEILGRGSVQRVE